MGLWALLPLESTIEVRQCCNSFRHDATAAAGLQAGPKSSKIYKNPSAEPHYNGDWNSQRPWELAKGRSEQIYVVRTTGLLHFTALMQSLLSTSRPNSLFKKVNS
jgi:hypothetical protein